MRIFMDKAVLFLHAFPLNSKMYKFQFEELEKHKISYIAIDYPGFGTERNFPSLYSIDTLTDLIVSKLKDMGVNKIIPIGDSMGGYIMFDFWRRYRDLIDGLIFVSTRAEADTEEAKLSRYELIEKIKNEGKEFLIDNMIKMQTSPSTKKDTKKLQLLNCIMNEASTEGMIKALRALAERPDNSGLLSSINVPTLVIAGKDDEKITPPEVVKKIADGIKNSNFVILKNSAHLPPFENPNEFNKHIIDFIKGVWY